MLQFSTSRKQRVVRTHKELFRELIRAYMHGSEARVDNLIQHAMMGDEDTPKLIKTDADVLIGLAQDFVATYRMMNLEKADQEQKSSLHVV